MFDILIVLKDKVLLLKCLGYQRKKTKLICDVIANPVPVEVDLTKKTKLICDVIANPVPVEVDLTKIVAVCIGERK